MESDCNSRRSHFDASCGDLDEVAFCEILTSMPQRKTTLSKSDNKYIVYFRHQITDRRHIMKHPLQAPFTESLPVPLFLRTTLMPQDAIFSKHNHSWGEFVYAYNGVVQVMVEQEHYLVPPQYGIWIPPNVFHVGESRREVLQSSLYIEANLCSHLPSEPQALVVSPFMRSVWITYEKAISTITPQDNYTC